MSDNFIVIPSLNQPETNTVKKGYVNVSVDYRLITESPLPTAIQDCMTAIRFLKCHAEEYGIDTTRMAVVGESTGGFLAGFSSFTCNTNIFTTDEWRGASSKPAGFF
ncbi:MAG: alpha/beta hydrolase [Mangrovibacterium sp.]|nr:alpha/beta hydrolase [Mangrovibacterium sp.]